jgi:hypothetical protein
MRVIATTVVRESIRGKQKTGYIYDIDWDSQQVTRSLPVPDPSFPESDDNPRGGVRGGRGVAATRHGIIVANYDTLYVYDDAWELQDSFTHPLFVGTHEIDWDGDHLWTAATGIDAVLRVGLDRSVEVAWDPHDEHHAERFGIRRRPHPMDGSVDYRVRQAPVIDQCHINGVTRHDGVTVVNCGLVRKTRPWLSRFSTRVRRKLGADDRRKANPNRGSSMVVSVNGSGPASVLVELANHDFPTHNGQLLDADRLALNDSTNNTLRVFSTAGARELSALRAPGSWLRGMEPVDAAHVLVGTAPGSVLLVDLEANEVVRSIQLSQDPNEAIHGLTICPEPAARR